MTSSLAASIPGKTPAQWARAFLSRLGAPTTSGNVQFVERWMNAESGGGGGLWNPLNSVLGAPGATDLNSVGVKNYTSYEQGLAASVSTFSQTQWSGVRFGLLANDQEAANRALNSEYATWGGGPLNLTSGALPGNTAGSGDATTTSVDGGADEGCILRLPAQSTGIIGKLPLVPDQLGGGCLLHTNQGRAMLGAFCLVAGGLLMLVGLGFIAVGGNTGRQIAQTVGPVAAVAAAA